MGAPITIVVTTHPTMVERMPGRAKRRRLKKRGQPVVASAQIRNLFSAKFVGGPHDRESVSGHYSADEAVGALIRQAVNSDSYETADQVLDFFASLFGHDPLRTPDVQLARAVRMAAKNPRRIHPGARVVLPDTARDTRPTSSVTAGAELVLEAPEDLELAPEKGGVA